MEKLELPSNYFGEHWEGYFVFLSQTRDSDCLERSNFVCGLEAIGGEVTADNDQPIVCVVRENHWACGWVEWIAIHETAVEPIAAAEKVLAGLENYPVVNEEHFSELEQKEADEVWRNCYTQKDRVSYIRKNRSQFDFSGFRDAAQCIAGEYFNGYASGLISN